MPSYSEEDASNCVTTPHSEDMSEVKIEDQFPSAGFTTSATEAGNPITFIDAPAASFHQPTQFWDCAASK